MKEDNKIPYRKWQAMLPHEKTQHYFATCKNSMRAQSAFWNNWQLAFSWFEQNYTY